MANNLSQVLKGERSFKQIEQSKYEKRVPITNLSKDRMIKELTKNDQRSNQARSLPKLPPMVDAQQFQEKLESAQHGYLKSLRTRNIPTKTEIVHPAKSEGLIKIDAGNYYSAFKNSKTNINKLNDIDSKP